MIITEDVKTVKIFGKNIPVRKTGCKNFLSDKPNCYRVPRVNLFIQTTNICNANCPFCIYHNNERQIFDVKKLEEVMREIVNPNYDIGKLNFTGGEPTLNSSLYSEISDVIRKNINYERKPEVTVNTNGYNLEVILKEQDILDCIGLSRHHYNDDKNYEIFKTYKVPSKEDISQFAQNLSNKKILQLRCNLIRGYVDDYLSLLNYMNHAIEMDIRDCGFVTLTPNNQYCKEHQIDFANLIKINDDIVRVNSWTRIDDETKNEYCQCANYVYSNEYGEMCKFYARLFCRNDNREGIIVYDGQNLRYGFGGEIIY